MKYLILSLFLLFSLQIYAQDQPKDLKTEFTKEVLSQQILNRKGKKQNIAEVLKNHQNKVVVIDFWASWCGDCVKALPETHLLHEKYKGKINFIYFSLDRSKEKWESGMERFGLDSYENYWFDEGWQNKFNQYIELNWIPRFLVVDQSGKIAHYYSISPKDAELVQAIDLLLES